MDDAVGDVDRLGLEDDRVSSYGYRYVPKCEGVPGHLVIDDAEADLVAARSTLTGEHLAAYVG